MIKSNLDLENFCLKISKSDHIAIDTEFKRTDTYFPILCLIQIATDEFLEIIDPISVNNFQPLINLLKNHKITWIFHSARQDLELIFNEFGLLPKKIFDTQIAANFLDFDYQISYQAIIEKVCNVSLEKKYTRIDWSNRPLLAGAIDYAADDVRYLIKLKNILEKKLISEKKLDWANEDFRAILNSNLYHSDIFESWKKVKGFSKINKNKYQYAFAISSWREQCAITKDKPRKWIISDEQIFSLANGNYSLSKSKKQDLDSFCEHFKNEISNFKFDKKINILTKLESEQKKQLQSSLVVIANQYNLKPEVLFNKKSIISFIKTRQKANFQLGWRYSLLKEELSKWETF